MNIEDQIELSSGAGINSNLPTFLFDFLFLSKKIN